MRAIYVETESRKLAERAGVRLEDARRLVAERAHHHLYAEDLVHLDLHAWVSVHEILTDPISAREDLIPQLDTLLADFNGVSCFPSQRSMALFSIARVNFRVGYASCLTAGTVVALLGMLAHTCCLGGACFCTNVRMSSLCLKGKLARGGLLRCWQNPLPGCRSPAR